jgi:hypothetical protein
MGRGPEIEGGRRQPAGYVRGWGFGARWWTEPDPCVARALFAVNNAHRYDDVDIARTLSWA